MRTPSSTTRYWSKRFSSRSAASKSNPSAQHPSSPSRYPRSVPCSHPGALGAGSGPARCADPGRQVCDRPLAEADRERLRLQPRHSHPGPDHTELRDSSAAPYPGTLLSLLGEDVAQPRRERLGYEVGMAAGELGERSAQLIGQGLGVAARNSLGADPGGNDAPRRGAQGGPIQTVTAHGRRVVGEEELEVGDPLRLRELALALRVRANGTANNSVRCLRRLVSPYAAFAGRPAARAPSGKERHEQSVRVQRAAKPRSLRNCPRQRRGLPADVDHGVLLGGLQRRSLAS
jgi:hypothetical protein